MPKNAPLTRASAAAAVGLLSLAAAGAAQAPATAGAPEPGVEPPEVDVSPPVIFATEALDGSFPREKLVVMDRARGRALLVDPATRTVLVHAPTGLAPHEVAVSPDGRRAYVANYGVDAAGSLAAGSLAADVGRKGPEGSITVLDLETGSVVATLRPFRSAAGRVLPVTYRLLHGIQVGEGGARLWLTSEADSSVLELDARTGEVLMQWKTGAAMGRTLVLSQNARKLFIANRWSDSVSVIDRLTITAHRIPTGRQPEGLAISPGGRELWVGNRGDHTITVVDARRQRRLATLDAGGLDPVRLAFRPDGSEVWVANAASRELAVFDARSRERVATVPLEVEPLGLTFSADGSRLYATAPEAGRVVVVDTRWRHVLDAFETGGAPHGVAWSRAVPASAVGQ